MSPEDDLQTQRLPAINEMPVNTAWTPVVPAEELTTTSTHHKPSNGLPATTTSNVTTVQPTAYTNGSSIPGNGVTINGKIDNNQQWNTTPLLMTHGNHLPEHNDEHLANNNEWSPVTPNLKNGWKEVPQDDEANGASPQHKLNGGIGMINGKCSIYSVNGHSDKLAAEQDPLTGSKRPVDLDELSNCGIGSCQPKWARTFASTHAFMVVFLLAWILQVNHLNSIIFSIPARYLIIIFNHK